MGAALFDGMGESRGGFTVGDHARCSAFDGCQLVSGAHRPHAFARDGDQVLFGIALTASGHWAHGIRMGALGPAKPEHRAMWQQVCEMLEAGQNALRPGAQVAECEAAMNALLQRHFDTETIGKMVRFRNGHGLGHSYEDPLLASCFPQYFGLSGAPDPAPDLVVRRGMLLELHPNFFLPQTGGAAIGQMVLVGEAGNENLISHPIDFF